MNIRLHHPLRPFSHLPETSIVMPGTYFRFQIFPALIRVWNCEAKPELIAEITLNILGPVSDFTVQLDLEKLLIKVWGNSPGNYWRYILRNHSEGFELKFEKEPFQVVLNSAANGTLENRESSLVFKMPRPILQEFFRQEKLFLGVGKAQCWELIQARKNLAEIFPFWLRLGQLLPEISRDGLGEGTTFFLKELWEREKKSSLAEFEKLFQAGFSNLLSPKLEDDLFQGYDLPPLANVQLSPLVLLQEGARLIRALFFEEKNDTVEILHKLPSEFHCGKFINIESEKGVFHLEWTKKNLRRMVFESHQDQTLVFQFSSALKSFRLKSSSSEKGERLSCSQALAFVKNKVYFFDCFEK